MRGLLLYAASLVAALLCGTVAGLLVFPFGLVVVEFVIFPLTFCIAALFAALGASWAGTLLAPNHTSTRLLPVVGVSEVAAVVVIASVAVVFLVPAVGSLVFGYVRSDVPILGTGMVIIGLGASWGAWHFRRPGRSLGRDAKSTLLLVALALAVLVGTLFVASLFGMVGA